MNDDKGQIEEYAKDENNWVRARILKQDPPPEGSLVEIAERARDMAANSLGSQHSTYAVALLNLGIYYDFIEHNSPKAREFFEQARAILEETTTGRALYGDALFHLGTARKQRKLPMDDPSITEAYLEESDFTQRRLSAEQLLADETRGSGSWIDRLDEACIYHSRDEETAAANPAAMAWEERFASGLHTIAGIVARHRDYLHEYHAAPWGCATPLEVCERLAAFARTDAQWLRRLADAYYVIANEQSGADQLASFRAALFFGERLMELDQQRTANLRQRIEQAIANEPQ